MRVWRQMDVNGLESVIGVARVTICSKVVLGPETAPPPVKGSSVDFVCHRGERARCVVWAIKARIWRSATCGVRAVPWTGG